MRDCNTRLFLRVGALIMLALGLRHACSQPLGEIPIIEEAWLNFDVGSEMMLLCMTAEDGGTTAWVASAEAVTASPDWEGMGRAPLPISEAVRIAAQAVPKADADGSQPLQLQSVTLSRICSTLVENRWYYAVTFQTRPPRYPSGTIPRQELVCVLLDGTVVEHRRVDVDERRSPRGLPPERGD